VEILGVANRVGSLEKGKDADIRILSGDPLDLQTKVETVIIDREIVHKA
jgi:imidazolonepropionase-like amidohydrolase